MDARTAYEQGRELNARAVAAYDGRSRQIGTARLVVACAALALLGVLVWVSHGAWVWAALAGTLMAFGALVVVHARVLDARERAAATLRFHERGLARLSHAWDALSAGSSRFLDADHPFAGDLDVFGRASLMQLVDATETRFGEERLAQLLAQEDPGAWPDDVVARQGAAQELAPQLPFREALSTAGGVLADDRPDPTAILAWVEGNDPLPAGSSLLGWLVPAVTVALAVAWLAGQLRSGMLTGLFALELAASVALGERLSPMLSAVAARESGLTRWRAMIDVVERARFDSSLLAQAGGRLQARGRRASAEIATLERIVGYAAARHNEVFRFFLGPLVFWDGHCARALVRWRGRVGRDVRGWLEALGEVEALASLGSFAFEHPDFVWPEFAPAPAFVASALGHPLIAAGQRVGNDVTLPSGGRALVVTGSNMSGKSTLLRAIGANAVLAFAGAPVCARALTLGPARVATSMRVEDSLEEGVSHFYAELRRLKRVVDLAEKKGFPALFLLDEILHGTNSRERVIGACAVVRRLLGWGALGAVSTHDLGITALEKELGARVENVHFEEQVDGERMTFDYRLRPGVVQSSNALRLMRALGIVVGDGDG
ncbi:MAG TPA: MutS family DNA mismatch repair protein [Polyangiaceae bacterium]